MTTPFVTTPQTIQKDRQEHGTDGNENDGWKTTSYRPHQSGGSEGGTWDKGFGNKATPSSRKPNTTDGAGRIPSRDKQRGVRRRIICHLPTTHTVRKTARTRSRIHHICRLASSDEEVSDRPPRPRTRNRTGGVRALQCETGNKLRLQRVPSHVEVGGNEAADRMAKEAAAGELYAIAQQAHDYGSNAESPPNSDGSPAMQAPPATKKTDERAKMAARNERGSEQLARPRPPEARYYRVEVGRGMLMDGVVLEQAPSVRSRMRMRPDRTPAKASKAVVSRFYQLRTGHALIGPYLKKIGKRTSDTCSRS